MVSPAHVPRILLLAASLLFPACLLGQASDGDEKLAGQVQSLSESIRQARSELSESRAEIRELRMVVEQMRNQLSELTQAASASPPQAIRRRSEGNRSGESDADEKTRTISAQSSPNEPRSAAISQDDWELLNAKVEEQHQDKVESGSKFRLKLSGLLLMNALTTSGQVDNLDLANVALPRTDTASRGSTAASLRQSIIGLTGTGPTLVGANTAADLQFDFFGGLPAGYGSAGSGVARIRLARIRFDWENRSVVGGLDTPFFSPNSPTTYVSVAEPGSLHGWEPVGVESFAPA